MPGTIRRRRGENRVKPPPFEYVKARSLAAAIELLGRQPEAKILAGGQSLIASLNMRLSAPPLLIDINGLDELSAITVEDGTLRVGALAGHSEVERSPEVARHAPLISQAMPQIGHPAIRNRGTFGGSIAFADPAAELPACVVALDGRIVVRGKDGARTVEAARFFRGLYETDLGPDEVVTAVEIPVLQPGYRSVLKELVRRHGDYAMAGVAAHARVDGGGALADLRLVFFGLDVKPVRAANAAAALEGRTLDEGTLSAAKDALAEDLDPPDDLQATGATKLHLARVVMGRALEQLTEGVR
jgi:carbon-monoxide dehydrogenase medium subunit